MCACAQDGGDAGASDEDAAGELEEEEGGEEEERARPVSCARVRPTVGVFGSGAAYAPYEAGRQSRQGTFVTSPTRRLKQCQALVLGLDRGVCVFPEVVRLPHKAVAVLLFLVLRRQTAARGDNGSGKGRRGGTYVCADGAPAGGCGEDEAGSAGAVVVPSARDKRARWRPGERAWVSAEGRLRQLKPDGEQRFLRRGGRRERVATVGGELTGFSPQI